MEKMKFAWYEVDWKETPDMKYIEKLRNKVGGKGIVTELECIGDSEEYCIHSHELDDNLLNFLRDARYQTDEHEYAAKRFKENVLELDDYGELLEMINIANPDKRQEALEILERNYHYNPLLAHGIENAKKMLERDIYENKEGHVWQIESLDGFGWFDFVIGEFVKQPMSTTYLPLYDLGEELIERYELRNVKLTRIKV